MADATTDSNTVWASLRKPFDGVQKVTKKWQDKKTGEWKSITLDYIGHAPVTDRLLSVDPRYSFEPLLDDTGKPIIVTEGLGVGDNVGVWGRLTILDSTVVEFCSGKDLMDAYSRCLCRCAMRRGVALDLWIKDDEFKQSVEPAAAVPAHAGGTAAAAEPRSLNVDKVATDPLRKKIATMAADAAIPMHAGSREAMLEAAEKPDLTREKAHELIEWLERRAKEGAPA